MRVQAFRKAEAVKEGVVPGKVLLVTQTQATLEALSGHSVVLATTAFSASSLIIKENPSLIIWDLKGPHLETDIPVFIWKRDIHTAKEIDCLLRRKHQITEHFQPNATPIKQSGGFKDISKIPLRSAETDQIDEGLTWLKELFVPETPIETIPVLSNEVHYSDLQLDGIAAAVDEQADEDLLLVQPPPDKSKEPSQDLLTDLSRRITELENSVEIDALTGLYNRKYFDSWINKQITQSNCFSLAIIDIDKFKSVNDTYGHLSGDEVLKHLGHFIRTQLRISDIAVRYGGEEFVIGFPGTGIQETYIIVERLRQEWEQENIPITEERQLKCTFSAGIAEYQDGRDRDWIISQADKYLYEAKNTGRNKVCGFRNKVIQAKEQKDQVEKIRPSPELLEKPAPNIQTMGAISGILKDNYKIISVWNPDGYCKADTALELARHYKRNVALLEFDLVNPELDHMMQIPLPSLKKSYNKDYWEIGAGLLTLGQQIDPELAYNLLYKYKWGIDYLPAGNRLGVTEIPSMSVEGYEKIIEITSRDKVVVIDVPADLNSPAAMAALHKCDVVIVPVNKPTAHIKEQVQWLSRAGLEVVHYSPNKAKGVIGFA